MKKITIVIPCYNEGESLEELIDQLKKINNNFYFVLVDNGSTDNTQSILKRLNIPQNIEVIRKELNNGYGAGIKFGLKKVKTDYAGWMHADLQQDAEVLLYANTLVNEIKESKSSELVAFKGLRTGRSNLENLFTIGVASISSILFFKPFWDMAGQPNIFKTSNLEFLKDAPDNHNFEFFVYINHLRKKGTFKRFHAPFHKRKYGSSSWDKGLVSKIKHARRIFKYILDLRFNS